MEKEKDEIIDKIMKLKKIPKLKEKLYNINSKLKSLNKIKDGK